MIQANELRIVNILNYQTAEGDIISTTLDWQDIKWISEDKKGFNLCHSPILLTEEWLLKLGFNTDYKEGYIGIDTDNTDFVLTYPEKLGEWQTFFAFEFKTGSVSKFVQVEYVHQLQNLFHGLTGNELEVKL